MPIDNFDGNLTLQVSVRETIGINLWHTPRLFEREERAQNANVQILHLEEVLQFMADYLDHMNFPQLVLGGNRKTAGQQ